MNVDNPFQIPTCFKLDIEQRRRERFKKTVVTAVIVSVAVVIGLLIEGCVSERSASSTPQISVSTTQAQTVPSSDEPQTLPEQPVQQSATQTTPSEQPRPVAIVPTKTVSPVDSLPATGGTVYSVKAGDTLSRIAKTHHTTVKALKAANNLTDDRISIGEQLKIPSV